MSHCSYRLPVRPRAQVLVVMFLALAAAAVATDSADAAGRCVSAGRPLALPGGGTVKVKANAVKPRTAKICASRSSRTVKGALIKKNSAARPVELRVKGGRLTGSAQLKLPLKASGTKTFGLPLNDVVSIGFFDPKTGTWTTIPSRVNRKRRIVTAKLPHFSIWSTIEMSVSETAGSVGQTVGQWFGNRAGPARCDAGIDVPRWAHPITDNGNEIQIRSCAEGGVNGDVVVQIVNNRPIGLVLRYGGPVTFGWHELPGSLGDGFASRLMDHYMGPNELYLPPLSRASVGIPRSATGAHQFTASLTHESALAFVLAAAFDGASGIDGLTDIAIGKIAGRLAAKCSKFIKVRVDGSVAIDLENAFAAVNATADCLVEVLPELVSSGLLNHVSIGKVDQTAKLLKNIKAGLKYLMLADVASKIATMWRDAVVGNGGFSVRVDGQDRQRAELTWDSETDVDLHVWDEWGNHAYYADREAIPEAWLVEDVIPGFGPEHFIETFTGAGPLTFGVCMYNGEYANVHLKVSDPFAGDRHFDDTLYGRKSAWLVADSPSGEGYLPSPGWCDRNEDYTYDPEFLGENSSY